MSLQQGSNLQPSVYKTDALPVELKRRLSSERDSNPRMSVLQTDTFTASPSERLLGQRDSNSHRRFWRPLCCRCTMPQSCGRCEIRTHGTLSSPSVFWTDALNHLGQPSLSGWRDSNARSRHPKCRVLDQLGYIPIVFLAEAERFELSEPPVEFSTLAGCRLRPLGHTSDWRE